MHSYFDLTYFREVRQIYSNIFVHFLVQIQTTRKTLFKNCFCKWIKNALPTSVESIENFTGHGNLILHIQLMYMVVIITNCYYRVTLVDPWFAKRILMTNGKLLAFLHFFLQMNVDIQKDQQCLSMYHITENGLMIKLKKVGLTPVFMSTWCPKHQQYLWKKHV